MASGVSGAPSRLASAALSLSSLRNDAYQEFISILDRLPPGRILLVVDPKLISPLKLVVTEGSKVLREHRVDSIVELTTAAISTSCENVLYLTRPSFQLVKLVAAQVKGLLAVGAAPNLHLYFVPRRTFVCEQMLKDEGVFADLAISEFGLEMVALDDDVLSLCLDTAFADVEVQGDTTPLFLLAQALIKLQKTFGHIPRIHAKGELSRQVVQMLAVARRQAEGAGPDSAAAAEQQPGTRGGPSGGGGGSGDAAFSNPAGGVVSLTVHELEGAGGRSEIDIAVLLDRSVDLVSPLVTPLTYEALLDEVVGLDASMATVDFNVVYDEEPPAGGSSSSGPPSAAAASSHGKVVVHLNSNDKLYAEIRDQNVEVAGARLQARAKELLALEDSVRKGNAADLKVADLKKFVKSIPGLQQDKKALRICINLLEALKGRFNDAAFVKQWRLERDALDEENVRALLDHVSALVATQAPKEEALRLLCLQCAIEGGFKQKALDAARRELLQAYGFAELALPLYQLERCGLLTSREGGFIGGGQARSWAALRRTFGLTATDVNLEDPADIHFVTSGYAPLSVRLVQAAVAAGGTFAAAPLSGASATLTGSPWEFGPVADAVHSLPGPTLLVIQALRADLRERRSEAGDAAGASAGAAAGTAGGGSRKVVLVVYVGGVAHIELAALRFLSERLPYDFIVLTTGVLNGTELVASALATSQPSVPGPASPVQAAGGNVSDRNASGAAGAIGAGSAPPGLTRSGTGTASGTTSSAAGGAQTQAAATGVAQARPGGPAGPASTSSRAAAGPQAGATVTAAPGARATQATATSANASTGSQTPVQAAGGNASARGNAGGRAGGGQGVPVAPAPPVASAGSSRTAVAGGPGNPFGGPSVGSSSANPFK